MVDKQDNQENQANRDNQGNLDNQENIKTIDKPIEFDVKGEQAEKAEKVLKEFDKSKNYRQEMHVAWKWIIAILAISLSVFQLYTAIFGTLPSNQQRGFHVAFALGLIFLLYPAGKRDEKRPWLSWVNTAILLGVVIYLYIKASISIEIAGVSALVLILFQLSKKYHIGKAGINVYDVLLATFGLSVGLYHFFFYESIISRVGMYNNIDFMIAAAGVLLVMEASRRVVGLPIVVVASAMLVYAYLGPYLPEFFQHRGYSVQRIISHSFLSMEGIFGIPISISATFIYLYILFGVILQRTGLEKFFSQLAMSMAGWMTGGPAKVGVLTSVFSGTITGSSVANTVGNGAFTIPMMKRAGYRGEYAAAVEAASSTGGQIMPPIMGSAAFLMIEFTGLPYSEILKAALIPALLFFTAQFIAVHYESKKNGIMGIARDLLPKFTTLMITKGYMLLPIAAIIFVLSSGQSPMKAALYGIYTAIGMNIVVMILAFILNKKQELDEKLTGAIVIRILIDSARTALPVIAACAAAGIIVGVITLTGLGLRIAGGIIELANHKLLLTMVFTMIASIILGMGLPTTANYVIVATMAAPALLAFDSVPVIAAHLFVFYFGIVADITPPVALAAYAGSGIAGSNPFKTSMYAVKIAIGAFIIPYMFVLSPMLLMQDVTAIGLITAVGTAIIGMFCISTSLTGYIDKYLTVFERIILAVAGLGLLYAHLITDLFGLLVFLGVITYQKLSVRKAKKLEANMKAESM
ncbi:TRAP transporter permease [Desulfuribacillus alkaliarsenatis]|uniref:TRAP C4-dicarboxylate transport system permease DctM subunit domain-containing protein n=1 Tax=Desulfuribacillus alkaliarsenatis TaxID=766136 RepID=A0A1E5G3I6_9FIRM|nr:TRAP transporter permease [Desulfuribacillus alkaliarsenatis]OEF97544.1 hypothetical protein BHF68_04885 [Desulfuribacillus alkaliarsenatis]